MRIVAKAAKRNTGYEHNWHDSKIEPKRVELEPNGSVTVNVDMGPIYTSGEFKAKISLTLSELHYLMGVLEEKKLELLLKGTEG